MTEGFCEPRLKKQGCQIKKLVLVCGWAAYDYLFISAYDNKLVEQ